MNVLIDTGFWFSYLGTREIERRKIASSIYRYLDSIQANFIIPYPTLYETINTKLLKEKKAKEAEWFLKQLNSNTRFLQIPDNKYKEEAYRRTVSGNNRGISLVDNIIRVMMEDDLTIKIDGLVTFNTEDFVDLCIKRCINLYDLSFQEEAYKVK